MSRIPERLGSLASVARSDPGFAVLAGTAWLMLIVARGIITVLPLRRISSHLGLSLRETPTDGIPKTCYRQISRIRRAIDKATPHTPTNSNCYPQALVAHALLRAARLPSTFYYGAAFGERSTYLETHVWVRCGPLVVTGAPQHLMFATVSAFAYVPRGSHVPTTPADLSGPVNDARVWS